MRTVCWFSAGAASAVATKLTLAANPEALPVMCDTGAEHADNARFADECAEWFGREIQVIRSEKYRDTWDVWESRSYLAGISGAPCTNELKIQPRLAFQKPDDIHVFGYTADASDVHRAERLRENYVNLQIETPLIDQGITKEACLAMIERAGLTPPLTYDLGFPNANCLPCVKATSPNYWALVRKEFPDIFDRMSELSKRLDVRLARINGDRVFIEDIPEDWPTTEAITPSCDFLCALAEMGLETGSTQPIYANWS